MHAATAAPEPAAQTAPGSGAPLGVADALSVLWHDGTARALPQAHHVTFLLQLQAWRGRPLAPQAQLLLLRQVCRTLDTRLQSPHLWTLCSRCATLPGRVRTCFLLCRWELRLRRLCHG